MLGLPLIDHGKCSANEQSAAAGGLIARNREGLQDTREAAELVGNYSLPLHSGAISCVGHVPDLDATVTCGMDGKIFFFDLIKRRVTRTFGGHLDRPVFTFAYSKR